MDKYILTFLLAYFMMPIYAKNSSTIGNITYTEHGGYASARAAIDAVDLIVEQSVIINGQIYDVTEIEAKGFRNLKRVKTIALPNSINYIGHCAFENCTNLHSIKMPTEAVIQLTAEICGFGGEGVFMGCKNLTEITSYSNGVPAYVVDYALAKCKGVPFLSKALNNGWHLTSVNNNGGMAYSYSDEPFSEYLNSILDEDISQWQKRLAFESTDEWKNRVNPDTYELRVRRIREKAMKDYIDQRKPAVLTGILGHYNDDYSVFTVQTVNLGEIYVKVPEDEKDWLSRNWSKVQIHPEYGIVNDRLAVVSCEYTLEGKTYKEPKKYDIDDVETLYDFSGKLDEVLAAQRSSTDTEVKGAVADSQLTSAVDIIDIDIPASGVTNSKTYAIIIGNENYKSPQVTKVSYADNDAYIFRRYCESTLGIPAKNIQLLRDATANEMRSALRKVKKTAAAFDSDINFIFYYAGHGLPDNDGQRPLLLPSDADAGSHPDECFSLSRLYEDIEEMEPNMAFVMLDACFSGMTRDGGFIDPDKRRAAMNPRFNSPKGNTIVLSASSEAQTAQPFTDKRHGLFTYHLLSQLQKTKGNITLGELARNVQNEVKRQSAVSGEIQEPQIAVSPSIEQSWGDLKLRP